MIEKIIKALEEERREFISSALFSPSDKTLYEFGRMCGIYQGLTKAMQVIMDLLNESDKKERSR